MDAVDRIVSNPFGDREDVTVEEYNLFINKVSL